MAASAALMPFKSSHIPPAERKYLTIGEAAAYFGISTRTITRSIRNGSLPDSAYTHWGTAIRIDREALEAHLAARGRIHTNSGPTAA
jgi:excisionase family DNA binding protein